MLTIQKRCFYQLISSFKNEVTTFKISEIGRRQ